MKRPRLLVLSHVLPFLGESGQQQRVYYTLKAVRESFHVTFATAVDAKCIDEVQKKISTFCDEVVVLPAKYSRSKIIKGWYKVASLFYSLRTGLKPSNYLIGRLEFAPSRMRLLFESSDFDLVLFEYWHASDCVCFFRQKGIPCVLDMHNILWQSYIRQLNETVSLPGWWKRWAVTRYKRQEEDAWKQFDAIIAINAEEERYVRKTVSGDIPVFYAPMGTDLNLWSYSWKPAYPPRIAYYGGLGSAHNQRDALTCYKRIMPEIWRELPKAELWLVGSNPPGFLRALSTDSRVKVTGYVENIQQVLSTMSVVVCPWSGTYGFRSRLVEAMALGVPVVAYPEALYGMEIEVGRGIFLEETPQQIARACLGLLQDPELASKQSRFARTQVEEKFSYDATYGRLARDLLEFTHRQKNRR